MTDQTGDRRVDAVTLHREREAAARRSWVYWRGRKAELVEDLRREALRADDHCATDTRFVLLRDVLNDAADALEAAPR